MTPLIQEANDVGIDKFTIWNEPNLASGDEGYGSGDNWAEIFNDWFIEVFDELKRRFPESTFGFPPLAILQNDLNWLDICKESINKADFFSCNPYYQNFEPDHENHKSLTFGRRYIQYADKYPEKIMDICEFGCSNAQSGHPLNYDKVTQEYQEWMTDLNIWNMVNNGKIRSATFFIQSSPDSSWESFAWVTQFNEERPMVEMLSEQIEAETVLYYPTLPWNQYTVWDGGHFLDPEYYDERGFWHTGCDINDKRGGSSDLGANVHSIGYGIVTSSYDDPEWGNIIVIKHQLNGEIIWSQYAHLQDRYVIEGGIVKAGEIIGTIGEAENTTAPHLHHEIRYKNMPPNYWGGSKSDILNAYYNPLDYLAKYNGKEEI